MDIITFVPNDLMIVIAAIYVLGVFFKNIAVVPDKFIPIILMVCSVGFSLALTSLTVTAGIQGSLCWGVTVGINQTIKQVGKAE